MKRFFISAIVIMSCFMANAQSFIPDVNLSSGGEKKVNVSIPNGTNLTAFQFDIALPAGVTVTGATVNGPSTRKTVFGTVGGKCRVLSYDESNTKLESNSLLTLTFKAGNGAATSNASTSDVLFVDPQAESTTPAGSDFAINVSDGDFIEFKAAGKLLMVSNNDLDFTSLGDEVKAYIATGYDLNTDEIILSRIKDVPAGTPIWVYGPKNTTKEVAGGVSKTYYPKSFIVGSATEKTTIPVTDESAYSMTLSPSTGQTGGVTSSFDIDPGKAYLRIPRVVTSSVGAASETINLTAKDNKEAYVSPCDLDFTNVSGLSAFIITGYTSTGSSIWLTPVKKVSANTPLYLKGQTNEYTVPSSAQKIVYVNMLKGSATSTSDVKDEENGFKTWILSSRDGIWGPYGYDNPQFPQGKAYLPIPKSYIVASRGDNEILQSTEVEAEVIRVKLGSLNGDDDETTGIRDLMINDSESDVWYNLRGQRIDTPTKKGLYIHNGRKVVVK